MIVYNYIYDFITSEGFYNSIICRGVVTIGVLPHHLYLNYQARLYAFVTWFYKNKYSLNEWIYPASSYEY